MDQWSYDTICKAIQYGVPVFAPLLLSQLQTVMEEYQQLKSGKENTKKGN